MTDPSTPPSAAIGFGPWPSHLHGIPRVADLQTPGHVTIILGYLHSGLPVFITTSSLEWLDDLESAVQIARAQGVVTGMEVTP